MQTADAAPDVDGRAPPPTVPRSPEHATLVPRAGARSRRATLALTAEVVAGLVLAALLVRQLLSYPVTDDPDPDGYVTYARHLKDTWSLLDFTRLPGYPFFLAVVDSVGPSTMHVDVYWTQFGLYLIWVAVLWHGIRRLLGPLVALAFLALLAAPNFYTRFAVVMVADFLGSVIFTLAALVLLGFVTVASRRSAVARLVLMAVLAGATYLVHPLAVPTFALLIVCLGLAALVHRRKLRLPGGPDQPLRRMLPRLAVALAALVVVTSALGAVADRGSSRFSTTLFVNKLLICLPPAADTEDDRRIEAMKAEATKRLGYPVEDAPPIYPPEVYYDLYVGRVPGIHRPDVADRYKTLADLDGGVIPDERFGLLWRGRLLAYPGEYLGCNLRQALWRYHVAVKQYAPFASERRLTLFQYIPETDALRSRIYRASGIELLDVPDSAGWAEVRGPLLREVARIASFVLLVGAGAVVLLRRFPVPALAVVLTLAAWSVFLVTVHVVDARYYTFFAPAIYLAEAAGLVALAQPLARRILGSARVS